MRSFIRNGLLYCLFLFLSSFFRLADAASSSGEVVAVFPKNFPPQYQLTPEGEPYGFAIEVMDEVARRAGLDINYIPVDNWQEVWKRIENGTVDLVPNMGITPERGEKMLFTQPYESFSIRIFVRTETTRIKGLQDLKGKRVGTSKVNVANSLVSNIELTKYMDSELAVNALLNRELDAVILPDIVVQKLASLRYQGDQIEAVGEPLKIIRRAIGVSRANPDLFNKINSVMDAYLRSAEFRDTEESWGRSSHKQLSIDQLVKLNVALLAVLILIAGFLISGRFRSHSEDFSFFESDIGLRIVSLIGILFTATLLTTTISLWFLYDAAFEGQKSRLVNIVQSRARIIESVARYDLANSEALGLSVIESNEGTLSQVREAHDDFRGFGQTGEFTFARRVDDRIAFILRQRHSVTVTPQDIPWQSPQAEPMRRALSGHSGTLIGPDYRGVKVLAAHEPVRILDAGIVAKIDLDEIRLPYIRSGLIVLAITLCILGIGVLLFFILTSPILNTLAQAYARLKAIIDHSPGLIIITDRWGNLVFSSPKVEQLTGELPQPGESNVELRDGSVHTYLTSIFPLTTERNRVFGSCQISTDITKRVAAETELKQLALAFESTSEGMMITDAEGKILSVNRAFEKITGYEGEQVIGRNPRILSSGQHNAEFYQELWQSLIEKGEWRGEIWNRRLDGEAYPEWLNISTVYNSERKPSHYVAVFSDITSLKRSQDQLYHLAHHDPLTGLPNRLLFRDRLEHSILQAHRNQQMVALFAIDLDRFKNINDSLGHPVGDSVLKETAKRLQSLVRENDTVARMGGDEFTIIAEGFNGFGTISNLARKIVTGMANSFNLGEQQVMGSISLGVAVYPQDGDSYEDLLKNADTALYKAKEQGRNNYQFYTQDLSKNAYEKLVLENQMLRGLEEQEFVLYYQPQFDIETGKLESAEALVRWQHPEFGQLPPDRFIPLAEESGLIIQLGEWVLKTACQQAQIWLEQGYQLDRIAVNLSGRQIVRPGLLDSVNKVLKNTGLAAHHLELEVTEGFIMGEGKESIHLLEAFSKLGISIAIDDFGTGYSSLAYLKRLPISTLKIDRGFIQDLPNDDEDAAISRAVIALGHSLGMKIIAEGVESQSQLDFLTNEGCEKMQGFLKGHPVSPEQFEELFFNP